MKRILPVAIVAVLIVAGVTLSLSVGAGGGSQAPANQATIRVDVWEAVESGEAVEVYIAVRPPAGSAQLNILTALGPEDFQLTYAFERYGLVGLVTESGLRILAKHPDVRGVEIPYPGTWNLGTTVASRFVDH